MWFSLFPHLFVWMPLSLFLMMYLLLFLSKDMVFHVLRSCYEYFYFIINVLLLCLSLTWLTMVCQLYVFMPFIMMYYYLCQVISLPCFCIHLFIQMPFYYKWCMIIFVTRHSFPCFIFFYYKNVFIQYQCLQLFLSKAWCPIFCYLFV